MITGIIKKDTEKDKIEASSTDPINYFFKRTPSIYRTTHGVFQVYEINHTHALFIVVETVFLHILKKT